MNIFKYLVLQIGCIECGVSSYPVAWCSTYEEAKRKREEYPSMCESECCEGFSDIWKIGGYQ